MYFAKRIYAILLENKTDDLKNEIKHFLLFIRHINMWFKYGADV